MFSSFFNKNSQQQGYPSSQYQSSQYQYQYPPQAHINTQNQQFNQELPPPYQNPIMRYHQQHRSRFCGSIIICLSVFIIISILSSVFVTRRRYY